MIQLTAADDRDTITDSAESLQEIGEQVMLDADGDLTLEGAAINNFLESVSFDSLFDSPEVRAYITVSEGYGVLNHETGEYDEAAQGDANAVPIDIETIPAAVAAAFIDEDDLAGTFAWHVANEIDPACEGVDKVTLKGKAIHEALKTFVGSDIINEYKKGAFVKLSNAGGASRRLVNRMLGAMLAKGDVHRAAAGNKKRYHASGSKKGAETYTQHYAKAGIRNPVRLNKVNVSTGQRTHAAWKRYRLKNSGKIAQAAKKTLGARTTTSGSGKVTSKDIAKITTRKSKKQAMVKQGGNKKAIALPTKRVGKKNTTPNSGPVPATTKKTFGSSITSKVIKGESREDEEGDDLTEGEGNFHESDNDGDAEIFEYDGGVGILARTIGARNLNESAAAAVKDDDEDEDDEEGDDE